MPLGYSDDYVAIQPFKSGCLDEIGAASDMEGKHWISSCDLTIQVSKRSYSDDTNPLGHQTLLN